MKNSPLTLYSIDGEVIDIHTFVENNIDCLSQLEQKHLKSAIHHLGDVRSDIPPLLSRTQALHNGLITMNAKQCGKRSAYLNGFKIKGCRPEDATFPLWSLSPDYSIKIENIPFGVLTRECVMREILAYCFLKSLHIEPPSQPVHVFHYTPNNTNRQYALVQKVHCDKRAEAFIDCNELTLHDVIRLRGKGAIKGTEVDLKNVEKKTYFQKKTNLLIQMNFNGGFRGILNSNIGNDVISNNELSGICDFDTFFMLPMPESRQEIRHFTIIAFLELIKTSLPIIDFIDSEDDLHATLSDRYCRYSILYKLYRRRFIETATTRGLDADFIRQCIDAAFQTEAAFILLQELIPNRLTLRSFNHNYTYQPHN